MRRSVGDVLRDMLDILFYWGAMWGKQIVFLAALGFGIGFGCVWVAGRVCG